MWGPLNAVLLQQSISSSWPLCASIMVFLPFCLLDEDKNFSSSSNRSISSPPVETVGLGFKCSGAQPKANIETSTAVHEKTFARRREKRQDPNSAPACIHYIFHSSFLPSFLAKQPALGWMSNITLVFSVCVPLCMSTSALCRMKPQQH